MEPIISPSSVIESGLVRNLGPEAQAYDFNKLFVYSQPYFNS